MKQITHISSIVVLTAAMGFGITVPVMAGEHPVATQGNVAYDVLSRSRCNHPDRTKCPRVIYQPEQESQAALEEQPQSATPRREGPQYCYRGYRPQRSPRRC